MWKEGATRGALVTLRHEVARRLTDANSWAPIGVVLTRGKRNTIPLKQVRKDD
jgi:hypothetical protein